MRYLIRVAESITIEVEAVVEASSRREAQAIALTGNFDKLIVINESTTEPYLLAKPLRID